MITFLGKTQGRPDLPSSEILQSERVGDKIKTVNEKGISVPLTHFGCHESCGAIGSESLLSLYKASNSWQQAKGLQAEKEKNSGYGEHGTKPTIDNVDNQAVQALLLAADSRPLTSTSCVNVNSL